MNAIVLNTLTGAVSEYTNHSVNSITPNYAGSAAGLRLLGGATDAGTPIVANVVTGKKLWGSSLKKFLSMVYLSLQCAGRGQLTVYGAVTSWPYIFPAFATGEARCPTGRGIRENYLAFGYSNPDGDYFRLDQIEVPVSESKSRRI
ncbi:hypothetical protein [Curvibacter lanceolatus]|uniref:hypothetical protein n=1 Tax=Curvibacter lanceolatus TaxID=86182 RepID=UPI00036576A1|nr:hypothetical protein [Curvibacter lanceolatus]